MNDLTDSQEEGYSSAGFRVNGQRRTLQRCLLDYIMNTYPIGRRKGEIELGEYRTKRAMAGQIEPDNPAADTAAGRVGKGLRNATKRRSYTKRSQADH